MVIDVLAHAPLSTDAAMVAALHAAATVSVSSGDRPMMDARDCASICGGTFCGSKVSTPPMMSSSDAHGMRARPYSRVMGKMLRKRTVRVEAGPVMMLTMA